MVWALTILAGLACGGYTVVDFRRRPQAQQAMMLDLACRGLAALGMCLFALSKQLDSAYALETRYGSLPLDEVMHKAVVAALRSLLQKQLDRIRKRNQLRMT